VSAVRACRIALVALAALPAAAQKFPVYDTPELTRGREVWMGTCQACHGNPDSDAPQALDRAAWKPRLAKGKPQLYAHALAGFRGPDGSEMPPRGGNPSLADDDVKRAVDYMTKIATP